MQDQQDAAELYWEQGLTLKQVGQRLGVGVPEVKRRVAPRHYGVRRPGTGRTIEFDLDLAQKLSRDMTRRALAKRLGVSVRVLARRFDKLRIVLGTPAKRKAEPLQAPVGEMHQAQGKSVSQIAQELGLSRCTVRRELVRLGVPLRSGPESIKLRWAQQSAEQRRERMARVQAGRKTVAKPASFDPSYTPNKAEQREQRAKQLVYDALCAAGMPPSLGLRVAGRPVDMAYPDSLVVVKVQGMPWSGQQQRLKEDASLSVALAATGWRHIGIWSGYGRAVDARAVVATVSEALGTKAPRCATAGRLESVALA